MEDAITLKNNKEITQKQFDDIINIASYAKQDFRTYEDGKNEYNLIWAIFNMQKAISYVESYPYTNCASEIYNISKKYKPLLVFKSFLLSN